MLKWLTLALALAPALAAAETLKTTIFAGGCFWCVESDFDRVEGVVETVSGYIGGRTENPTYREVVQGGTGHAEAVQITYDADIVSYETLLHLFWRSVDPTDAGGQFCDRGESYRTELYVATPEERAAAEASKAAAAEALGQAIVTEIVDAGPFYVAEAYHQDFYAKNPLRYSVYRKGCRRDARVQELWGAEMAFAPKS